VAVASAGPYAICILLQTNNHANTPPLSFLQAGCPSCRPTNSVKALKEQLAPILMTLKVFCLFEASLKAFSYRFAVVDYISTDMVCSCSASAVAELLGLFLCVFLEEQVVNTY